MARLRDIADPRHQGYVKYKSHVLLATRILSAIFYISSMRNTSFQDLRGLEEIKSERF